MNSLTVLLYLFGHAGAIRRVASSPMAVPTGILLVFSAAVARNYDQLWFGESNWWFLPPLIFAAISGLVIFCFTFRAWVGYPTGHLPLLSGIEFRHWRSFFGLFLMTAPIAWLYAIPVERWYEPVEAAQWNVRLLLVVALWRVLLMSRVVSVIGEVRFLRALSRVLLPAAIETLAVGYVASLGKQIMASMAGLRNSPAEDVLLNALSTAMTTAFFIAIIGGAVEFSLRRFKMRTTPWEPDTDFPRLRTPWLLLLAVASLGWWISIKPQKEQHLTHQAKELAKRKDWAGLVAFLSQHRKEEFAPSVPLPPTAWEFRHVSDLPFVIEKLAPETPQWVRELYAGYLDFVLEQDRPAYLLRHDGGFAKVLLAAEKIPEVRRVVKQRADIIGQHAVERTDDDRKRADLYETLDRIFLLPD